MYTPADEKFLNPLRAQLPARVFKEISENYLREPRGKFKGCGELLCPENTEHVSIIVSAAAAAGVAVIPYGGGTGLVGGQVSEELENPIVLSLERMNRVRAIYPFENTMVVEAGVILADAQAAAEEKDRLFPLSLASQGSARIGGNLSSNAGGLNVLRYGNARELTLGIEAVMPDGQIFNGLTRLRKDNTGYDLRNLLIGAEGSLGVITAATLKLFPRPRSRATALMVVPDPTAALSLYALAGDILGQGISAFELINETGLQFLHEKIPHIRQPFEIAPKWSVLVDVGLFQENSANQGIEALFEAGFAAGLVLDGVIAQNQAQADQIWNVRESIPEANRLIGAIASHDISLPLSAIAEFTNIAPGKLAELGEFRINCFGHLGDGNLHYNVYPPKGGNRDDYKAIAPKVSRVIHDLVAEREGSFSAEHGVGRMKVGELERYGDPAKLAMMRAIKTALDPKGIMNPNVMLRR
ncbi:oxidoreductase, FAD-binding protein [Rhodobacterales bacterium HTCC2150]|nr:oxidoreductase, FAD-binding protein [Rhodobacterales bacterium HTCC2150] [Rhodobacteraceae bacterium HTCC2150]